MGVGGCGRWRCEWTLLGEASPPLATLTYLCSSMHLSAKKDPQGLWSVPQARATFPAPSWQPWRTGLVEHPQKC